MAYFSIYYHSVDLRQELDFFNEDLITSLQSTLELENVALTCPQLSAAAVIDIFYTIE